MTQEEKKQLKIAACKVRLGIIEGVYAAKSGHPGGSLSAADVLAFCHAHLAAFKVPSEVHMRAELPHTVSMKVEKKLLK